MTAALVHLRKPSCVCELCTLTGHQFLNLTQRSLTLVVVHCRLLLPPRITIKIRIYGIVRPQYFNSMVANLGFSLDHLINRWIHHQCCKLVFISPLQVTSWFRDQKIIVNRTLDVGMKTCRDTTLSQTQLFSSLMTDIIFTSFLEW